MKNSDGVVIVNANNYHNNGTVNIYYSFATLFLAWYLMGGKSFKLLKYPYVLWGLRKRRKF